MAILPSWRCRVINANWGFEFVDHVRSRRPWRTRIALTVASILAAAALVGLTNGQIGGEPLIIIVLLVLGIVFGLRPWARK
jgi:hypothetical protein